MRYVDEKSSLAALHIAVYAATGIFEDLLEQDRAVLLHILTSTTLGSRVMRSHKEIMVIRALRFSRMKDTPTIFQRIVG